MKVFNSIESARPACPPNAWRMDVTANNIANVETTRTPDGGPYRRQMVVFEPRGGEAAPFQLPTALQGLFGGRVGRQRRLRHGFRPGRRLRLGRGLRLRRRPEPGPGRAIFRRARVCGWSGWYRIRRRPAWFTSPDIRTPTPTATWPMPNVSTVNEMVDMMSAQRAYEANVAASRQRQEHVPASHFIVGQSTAY